MDTKTENLPLFTSVRAAQEFPLLSGNRECGRRRMNFVYGSASVVHTRAFGRLGEAVREEIESWDLFPSFLRRASRLSSLPHIRSECLRSRLPLFLPEILSFNSVFPTFMQEGFPLGDFFHPTSFPFLHLLHAVLYYVDIHFLHFNLSPLCPREMPVDRMEMDSPHSRFSVCTIIIIFARE